MFCVSVIVLQSCDVMAAASVSRPGSAQTAEKSQLTLKGNDDFFFVIARADRVAALQRKCGTDIKLLYFSGRWLLQPS